MLFLKRFLDKIECSPIFSESSYDEFNYFLLRFFTANRDETGRVIALACIKRRQHSLTLLLSLSLRIPGGFAYILRITEGKGSN